MNLVAPAVHEAAVTALSSGTWADGFAGFTVPADVLSGVPPEGYPLPYLRLDGDGEREALGLGNKRNTPHLTTTGGTAWATSLHLARQIAAAAANRLAASFSLTGYRVLRSEPTLTALGADPQGAYGYAFTVQHTLTPA